MGCGASKEGAEVSVVAVVDPGKTAADDGSHKTSTAPAAASTAKPKESELQSKYELGKTLGSGSFATARVATHRATGEKVAIKTLMRNHDNFDQNLLNLEINVMKKLQSPYCISLKEVIEDSKAVHLVEELAVGGELFDRILDSGHFSEKDAAKVTKQVMLGISHMHSMGACHRDLKPENLLMVTGDKTSPNYLDVKIADFGLSSLRPVKDASMSTVCGTPDYLAPEVILIASEGPMSRRKYDAKVDVWAVGVICYTMICGYPPFWSENMADMLHMIKHGDYNFDGPSWESVSDETKSFVSFLLTRDPAKRPTSDECLQHPFLNSTTLKEDKLENSTLRHYIDSRRTGKIFRVVRVITRMERASRVSGERRASEALATSESDANAVAAVKEEEPGEAAATKEGSGDAPAPAGDRDAPAGGQDSAAAPDAPSSK